MRCFDRKKVLRKKVKENHKKEKDERTGKKMDSFDI